MPSTETPRRPSAARERLLDTATAIFYATGIHSVGVERIVATAQVTRATFYRHFPSKEDLVVAYLERAHEHIRAQYQQAIDSGKPPADILREIARGIVEDTRRPGFRGCAFLNAAAEYPDTDHPVHQMVLTHRTWFQTTITDLFTQTRNASGTVPGRHFVMLRDGVMAAGCLGNSTEAGAVFLHVVDHMVKIQVIDGVAQVLPIEMLS